MSGDIEKFLELKLKPDRDIYVRAKLMHLAGHVTIAVLMTEKGHLDVAYNIFKEREIKPESVERISNEIAK